MMKVLITGISGQDGSYLAEYLLWKGYDVYGVVRQNSTGSYPRIAHLEGRITLLPGDITDESFISRVLDFYKFDEIYNLAAVSDTTSCEEFPYTAYEVNVLGTLNILNIMSRLRQTNIKMFQATSSEIFGKSIVGNKAPTNIYGQTKLSAHNLALHYRESKGLQVVSGIMFNHESPRRTNKFVSKYVVENVVKCYIGTQSSFELRGSLDDKRDFSHAKDVVRAMVAVNHSQKDSNYIISYGKLYSIRQMCDIAFSYFKMDYRDFVTSKREKPDGKGRTIPPYALQGLGWIPDYSFESMITEMVEDELKRHG